MGYGKSSSIKVKPKPKLRLSDHPNFCLPDPILHESPISFALRCAAHLVSPPQNANESNEMECVDVALQLHELIEVVEAKWLTKI